MPKDPYRYFRVEARELLDGLLQGLLELEKGGLPDTLARVLRQAHTLKGAARVVKETAIADQAHALEDLLAPIRASETPADRSTFDQALALLDAARARLETLGAEPAAPALSRKPAPAPAEETQKTVRIEVDELDALLEHVQEASMAGALVQAQARTLHAVTRTLGTLWEQLSAHPGVLGPGRRNDIGAGIEAELARLLALGDALRETAYRHEREIHGLHQAAADLRLVPVAALVHDVERTVRDAAQEIGKRVGFEASGAEIRVDAHVLEALRKALLHVVRNAVAHGIEEPKARRKAGKPEEGRVRLAVLRKDRMVIVRCSDDGRGLDLAAIRKAARTKGLLGDADREDPSTLAALLLHGNLSTTPEVTGLAGRGVGLDAARKVVEDLDGTIELRSTAGQGTEVEMAIPASLAFVPVLELEVGGETVLAPLDGLKQAIRPRIEDIVMGPGGRTLVVDGSAVPFYPLAPLLSSEASPVKSGESAALVFETGGRRIAMGVERLGGVAHAVVRPLPAHSPAEEWVAGAALHADGTCRLVLSPRGFVTAAARERAALAPPERPRPAPILIIDDSLTTRMLEQSILESAGYEVMLATSGEEALRMAKERRCGLFLVDVEMPGMDGFEFIARARSDPALEGIPSILVTSRANADDKRRGREVGARAYIVKSEFEQRVLLDHIRSLLE